MSYYLFENPWPVSIAVGLCGVVMLWAFSRTGRRRDLLVAAICFLAIALFVALDQWVQTPAEQINMVLDRLAQAAVAEDPEAIVASLSDRCVADGTSGKTLADLVRREIKSADFQSVSLNGRVVEATDSNAKASFVAVCAARYQGQSIDRYPLRLTLTFEREQSDWKIVRIQRFEPISNTSREIPLMAR